MDLRDLRCLRVLAEEMHFGRAARRLNMTQPPLSRRVRALEDELGVALLARDGKRFALTEAGTFLVDGAGRILDEVASLERRARLLGDAESGCVRLGYIGSAMFSFLPDLLAALKVRLPRIGVEVFELATAAQAGALRSGAIDIGVIRSWVDAEGIAFEPLGEESLCIVYPRGMAGPSGPAPGLADFRDQPFVTVTRADSPRLVDLVMETCEAAGFRPAISYECGHLSGVLQLVAAGLGWSVLPALAVRRLPLLGIRRSMLEPTISFGLAYRDGPLPPRVSAVLDAARAFIRTWPGPLPEEGGA